MQKDRTIETLRNENKGNAAEGKKMSQQKQELRHKITDLENALVNKDREIETFKAKDKKLARLQRESDDKQRQLEDMRKAIDAFKLKMFEYTAEEKKLKEDNKELSLKEKHQQKIEKEARDAILQQE